MINDMHLARNSLIFKIAGILDDGSALHWSQVTASSLLGIGPNNEIVENGSLGGQPEESAACIHLGLRRIQPRAKVLLLALCRSARRIIWFSLFPGHLPYAHGLCHSLGMPRRKYSRLPHDSSEWCQILQQVRISSRLRIAKYCRRGRSNGKIARRQRCPFYV